MSRQTLLAVGLVALLGAAGATVLSARGQAPAQPATPFGGKVLLVLAKNNVAVTLEQVQVKPVAGRQFIVGQEAKGFSYTKELFSGGTVWVPVEDVTQLVELAGKGK